MKKNLKTCIAIAFFIGISFPLLSQNILVDTSKSQIANRYYEAVLAAQISDTGPYRSFLTEDAVAKSEGVTYTTIRKVDSICQPAIAAFAGVKVKVEKDDISVINDSTATQLILFVTLFTDTTRGIPIPHMTPQAKHMKLNIDWTKINGVWKIKSLDQNLWRIDENE